MSKPSSRSDSSTKQKSTFQFERLSRFYYEPPYGTRYWVLSPFVHPEDYNLEKDIVQYLGSIQDIRPMTSVFDNDTQ